jgi:hypothetical protein
MSKVFVRLAGGLSLLVLTGCGNDPPCSDPKVVRTVQDFVAKIILHMRTGIVYTDNQELLKPEEIDLSPAVSIDAIIVRNWDAAAKAAVCSGRFRYDDSTLTKVAKANIGRITDPRLRDAIETPSNVPQVITGRIGYSASLTSDSRWWVELDPLQDFTPD